MTLENFNVYKMKIYLFNSIFQLLFIANINDEVCFTPIL